MKHFQEALDKVIEKMLDPFELTVLIFKRQLEKLGYVLNESQLQSLRSQLTTFGEDDDININIPGINDDIIIDFPEEQELDDLIKQIEDKIPDLMENSIRTTSGFLLPSLKKDAPRMLREHKRYKRSFEKKISSVWGKSLSLLETLLVIATEAGNDINESLRGTAAENQDFVFDAVARLHARSCQISYEVLTLLKAGYADGAHARWRSLHELVVVAYYIQDQGQEAAKRYLLHQVVGKHKAAKMYQEHFLALKVAPFDEDELKEFLQAEKEVIDELGLNATEAKYFKKEYGWASTVEHPDPNFVDIARKSGFIHMSPYYKWASHNVHAGPMRFHSSLGLIGIDDNVLATGPSTQGLTIPSHSTAVSIMQITTLFLDFENTIDNIALCTVLRSLSDEVGQALIDAEKLTLND